MRSTLLLNGSLLLLSIAVLAVGVLLIVLGKGRPALPRIGGWVAVVASLFVLAFGVTSTMFLFH